MAIMMLDKPYVFVGKGSNTLTIPTTGRYKVHVESTEIPPSGVVITILNGASTVYTSPTLSPTQGAIQFNRHFQWTAADEITVTIASAVATDALLNTVKSIIVIGQGA